MSLHQYAGLVGIFALLVSLSAADAGCDGASKIESRELRGSSSLHSLLHGGSGGDPEEATETGGDEKDHKNEKQKLDESGSPTNKDIKKIEQAMTKKKGHIATKIYNWPLALRLCIVAGILAFPLLVITTLVYFTPPEQHSNSIYIKTALHCGYSFTVGWLNCIMLLRYRVFATMMVGNTILMGVAFICNGGWSTAHDENNYWWMGESAQALCPAQFENASKYLIMILLFMFGAFVHGLLHNWAHWTSRPLAPIIAAGIIAVEMLEYFRVIREAWTDVYLLSPIFGMFVSISAHGGVGSVPWSATGHMTSMAYKLASFIAAPCDRRPELQSATVNLCLWCSFILGIMMGTLFHSNRTVMLNALYLQCILIVNGFIYNSPKKDEKEDLSDAQDKNGISEPISYTISSDADDKANYSSCSASN